MRTEKEIKERIKRYDRIVKRQPNSTIYYSAAQALRWSLGTKERVGGVKK